MSITIFNNVRYRGRPRASIATNIYVTYDVDQVRV